MVKIFFPASGVGFSELYKLFMTFCHITVSGIFEQRSVFKSGGRAGDFLLRKAHKAY